MKKKKSFALKSREGGIAIVLLLIAFTLSAVVASYLRMSSHNVMIFGKARNHERARIVAESVLNFTQNKVRMTVEKKSQGLSTGTTLQQDFNKLEPSRTLLKNTKDYKIKILSVKDILGTGHLIPTNINGTIKEYIDVSITTGVSNKITGATASFQEIVRITREPFLRYAIFFEDLLELHPGPTMVVDGDMRSNTDIELFAWSGLYINGTIKAPGSLHIFKSDQSEAWNTEGQRIRGAKRVKVKVGSSYKSFFQDYKVLDSRDNDWSSKSINVWNNKVQVGNGISTVRPPLGDGVENHALIEPKKSGDSKKLKATKMAYKADLYIKVLSSGSVLVNGKPISPTNYAVTSGSSDNHGVYKVINNGFLNVQTSFYDPRESEDAYKYGPSTSRLQQMEMVDIYLDKLIQKYPNSKIIYVEMEDPPSGSKLKPAVRLRNGYDLTGLSHNQGISLATHRTTYVEGDFNAKDSLPALIATDNLTVLSTAWDDNNSKELKPRKKATETDLNAAVMIGYADPDNPDGKITGGAHNLVRFRENWGGINYNFTGSYISLWTALDSHALLSGRCYVPPDRHITYDQRFKTKQPPGMPIGYSTPEVLFWREISWAEAEKITSTQP